MRILIYSETENAKKQLESIRAEGHKASLRNPQYFKASELETADLILAENAEIIETYQAIGIKAESLLELKSFTVKAESPTVANNETVCQFIKKDGEQCTNKTAKDSNFCWIRTHK